MKITYTEQTRLANTSIVDSTSKISYKIDQAQDFRIIRDSNMEYFANSSYSIELSMQSEMKIPLDIIKNNSSLQSIVLYLKEQKDMTYAQIARTLNRDQRTIWSTYLQSKKRILIKKNVSITKDSQKYIDDDLIHIPLSIFSFRNLSILESIVFYLKTNLGLTLIQISNQLGKNYRTIWTVYKRAIKKISQNNE